jgi:hypothetical protein
MLTFDKGRLREGYIISLSFHEYEFVLSVRTRKGLKKPLRHRCVLLDARTFVSFRPRDQVSTMDMDHADEDLDPLSFIR